MRKPSLGAIAGGKRRRRVGAGLALLAVIAVVVVVVLNNSSSPSGTASADASQATGAATVERRNLTETDTEAGTLSYSNPETVYNRLGGTLTWLPQVGQVIKPGGTLYKVDGQPVILMDGRTPAYRTLAPGVSDGHDVLQLNRNLSRLGFDADGIVVDDVWQAATTVGVEQLQESLGETPTGTLTLGQVVFLPGPQLISTVDGTVGGDAGGGSGSGNGGTSASIRLAPARPEFVSLTTGTTSQTDTSTSTSTPTTTPVTSPTTSTTTTTPPPKGNGSTQPPKHSGTHHASSKQLSALIELLKAEIEQLKHQHGQSPSSNQGGGGSHGGSSGHHHSNSGSNSSHGSGSGSGGGSTGGGSGGGGSGGGGSTGGGGGSASEILQTTSTQLVVTVDLDASLQSEATVGEHVMVELPDGTWVPAKVTAVSAVATTSSDNSGNGGGGGAGGGSGSGSGSGGSSATIPVTITLKGHQHGAGLDQAAVSVNFSKAKAKNVLSVPVTALVATSGSSYAVQEAAAPHKLIPVTTGLFAAGYVQITGQGIHPGLQVTDSQG